jgi:hypothetical protein
MLLWSILWESAESIVLADYQYGELYSSWSLTDESESES